MMGMKMSGFFLCYSLNHWFCLKMFLLFFQPEEGGKQQQQYNSQYLEKIIEILQSSPLLAYRQVGVNGVFKSNAPPSGSTQCWPFNKGTGMEYGHESTSELC